MCNITWRDILTDRKIAEIRGSELSCPSQNINKLSHRVETGFERLELKIERADANIDKWSMWIISVFVGTVSQVLNNLRVSN